MDNCVDDSRVGCKKNQTSIIVSHFDAPLQVASATDLAVREMPGSCSYDVCAADPVSLANVQTLRCTKTPHGDDSETRTASLFLCVSAPVCADIFVCPDKPERDRQTAVVSGVRETFTN